MDRDQLPRWVLPVAAVLLSTSAALASRFYDEDALIILRFARNLAERGSLTFNPADPTYSITCPLWGLLLGAVQWSLPWITDERTLAAILAWLFGILTLLALKQTLRGVEPAAVAVGILVLAIDPYFTWGISQGNEMALFTFLALVGIAFYRNQGERPWRALRTGFVLGLLCVTRPEGLLLTGLIGVHSVARRAARWRQVVLLGFGAAIPLGLWLLFALDQYGTLIPLPMLAKGASQSVDWTHPLRYLARGLGRIYAIPVVILVLALVASRGRAQAAAHWRSVDIELIWVFVAGAFYIAGLRERVIPNRYLLVISPMLIVAAATLLPLAWRGLAAWGRPALLAAWLGWMLLIQVPIYQARTSWLPDYLAYLDACRWMAEHVPANARVFTGLLGGPAWLSDHHIVDTGIVSREAIGYRRGEITRTELLAVLEVDYQIGDYGGTPAEAAADPDILHVEWARPGGYRNYSVRRIQPAK